MNALTEDEQLELAIKASIDGKDMQEIIDITDSEGDMDEVVEILTDPITSACLTNNSFQIY